jgi:ERCC4-related helicase
MGMLNFLRELVNHLVLWKVGKRSGASKNDSTLKKDLEKFHVMVVTADILKNALTKEKNLFIRDLSLLVFDECHHTRKEHSYNSIMIEYLLVSLFILHLLLQS